MGMLIDGEWHDVGYDTKKSGGKFVRTEAQFRSWITADGSAGAIGVRLDTRPKAGVITCISRMPALGRIGRWCFARLKELEDHISVDVVDAAMLSEGWTLDGDEFDGSGDSLNGFKRLHQVYTAARPGVTTRVTVPVLWDKRTGTICFERKFGNYPDVQFSL